METSFSSSVSLLPFSVCVLLLFQVSAAQLSSSERRTLFEIQKLLEYPPSLHSWAHWTNFCYLSPSPSLQIVCTNNHVTELTIIGNKTSPVLTSSNTIPGNSKRSTLSENFSIDSFFTVLTKLSTLETLSLVSLGIWGALPSKISRLSSLQVLNMSSNFISGEIPKEIASFKSLKSLVFADNLFNGSVPDLKGLENLEELDLSSNNLGPKFPSFGSKLVTFALKNNYFGSGIPTELKKLNELRRLDLSSNKFVGSIPSFLFSLHSLQNLSLARNQLSGSLPNASCSANITSLDVSNNLLTGRVPSCLDPKNSANRTVAYLWNCLSSGNPKYQHLRSFCEKDNVAVKPEDEDQKKKLNAGLGLVFGIIGGVLVTTATAALLVLIVMRRSEAKKPQRRKPERPFSDRASICSTSKTVIDARRVPQTMRSAGIGLPPYRVFSLDEIEDATNNFDPANLVGEQLYKGWLRDGIVVMVKCIKLKQKNLPPSLVQNMEVLSKLRHLHLVSVLGHCIITYQDHPFAGSTIFVVQEYIANGSLQDYLCDWRKKEMLKWPQRMAITIGVARGIQFLHTGVAPGIFGNNLKIENILLDETLTAKISGYSIPLPSKVGADNPLNGDKSANSKSENAEKQDAYQFGVILLQVITGRIISSMSELADLKLQLESGLAEGASKLRSLVDSSVRGTYAYESVRTAVEFTVQCLCENPSRRPSIEDVVWNLQYTIQVQEGWNSSGNLGLGTQF